MGPFLLFDKSFLQGLSVDEAVILDQIFCCIVSPLFFAETLAGIAKEPDGSRDQLKIVGAIAERTPICHSYMRAYHRQLALENLVGEHIEMRRRPIVAGGIPVRIEGKVGVVYRKSPEADAFERWQQGRFLEVEHIAARVWRLSLEEMDLPAISAAFKSMLRKEARPRNHEEARALAQAIVDAPGQNYRALLTTHSLLGMPENALPDIISAWRAAGSPPLREYAQFAAYCLELDLYFYLALSNGIISDQRASNRIDIDYLCYLPFTNVFVSGDRLHRSAAELFAGDDQLFVWGPDLKRDLAELNRYFLSLPDEEKAKGLFLLADRPPVESTGICAIIWDKFRPGWRKPKPPAPELTREQHDRIINSSNRFSAVAENADKLPPFPMPPADQLDNIIVQRHIPQTRGSWRMFSKAVEEAERQRGSNTP